MKHTQTAFGTRLLRKWILRPLAQLETINGRLDAVTNFIEDISMMEEMRDKPEGMTDVEVDPLDAYMNTLNDDR
eukprot:UN20780